MKAILLLIKSKTYGGWINKIKIHDGHFINPLRQIAQSF